MQFILLCGFAFIWIVSVHSTIMKTMNGHNKLYLHNILKYLGNIWPNIFITDKKRAKFNDRWRHSSSNIYWAFLLLCKKSVVVLLTCYFAWRDQFTSWLHHFRNSLIEILHKPRAVRLRPTGARLRRLWRETGGERGASAWGGHGACAPVTSVDYPYTHTL